MQPNHYAFIAGIALMVTLALLPYLLGIARRRAFEEGVEDGLARRNADQTKLIKALNDDIAEIAVLREAEQRKHHLAAANLKRTISELEQRIMSYTGLAVTRADYELMISAAETLALSEKTWHAAQGTEPWCNRALQQRENLHAFAVRVHHQLRSTPATSTTAGEST